MLENRRTFQTRPLQSLSASVAMPVAILTACPHIHKNLHDKFLFLALGIPIIGIS